MANRSLGTLTLDLVARTGGFVQGMSKAERESKKWRRQVERDLRKIGGGFAKLAKISAAAGVAAAGAFTILAKEGLQYVDAQAKMARQVGASIDGLRGLQIAANDAGVGTNILNGAVDRLNVRLGEAREGSGQAYEALQDLGLSADALARMDADQRIATIADRVKDLGLDSADTADLLRNLGIRNREMVNLLMAGGDGIRAARQEVDDYGLALSEVDAAKVEQANDAMSRIPRILEPIRSQIAINLAEPLTDVSELIKQAARDSEGFADVVASVMERSAKGIAAVVDQLEGVRETYLRLRELDLNVQALLEKGQNAVTPGEQATPAMDALNEVRASLAAIEAGETAFSRVSAIFAGIGDDIARNHAARNLELDGLVDASGALALMDANARSSAEGLNAASLAAASAAEALKGFNPSKSKEIDDILDRAGPGATIDEQGQIRDAFGNTSQHFQRQLDAEMQRQIADFQSQANLKAGLDAAVQAFVDGAGEAAAQAWGSITPASPDDVAAAARGTASGADLVVPTGDQSSAPARWSSVTPGTGLSKINQAAGQVGAADRVPIHLTVTSANGDSATGEGEFERKLVDILSGAAAAR